MFTKSYWYCIFGTVMQDTIWKEFGKNKLTHSGAHYLMAIREVHQDQGYARLSDVANRLNISKGSLSISLKPLIKRNLILEDENKHLSLSEKGKIFADDIKNTYSVLKYFLSKILEVDTQTAEVDACKIEHLLSEPSTGEILKLVKALKNNPELMKSVKKEMHKYSHCSIKGCRICSDRKFCLK